MVLELNCNYSISRRDFGIAIIIKLMMISQFFNDDRNRIINNSIFFLIIFQIFSPTADNVLNLDEILFNCQPDTNFLRAKLQY